MVDGISQWVKGKRMAVLSDSGTYGDELSREIISYAPSKGLEIVARETYETKDTDVTAQLTKMMAAKPNAIINCGTMTDSAITCKGIAPLGIELPMFSWQATVAPLMVSMAGKAAEGQRFVNARVYVWDTLPPNDPHKKGLEAFAEAFKAKYGKLWNWNGGERAYDVAQLVAIALGKAGPSPRRQKIRDAAETICGYVGLQSTYCYSPSSHEGATTEAFIWATIKGG